MDAFQLENDLDRMSTQPNKQVIEYIDKTISYILNNARKKVEEPHQNMLYSNEKEK